MFPAYIIGSAFVQLLYATGVLAILAKEFNWKTAITITLANITAAIIIEGIAYRILDLAL
ncbi:MAG TPA: hypothetical protein VMS95_04100 [Candidatus Krumholzibacteriaceae bacterium]|nr:hypothetical protein [Candidatus Krumholzibacteriaceae bacterium]